jgi:hypothetical protein
LLFIKKNHVSAEIKPTKKKTTKGKEKTDIFRTISDIDIFQGAHMQRFLQVPIIK